MSSSDEFLLVQELLMDMHSDGGAGERRLAHVLPPLACAPGLPPFRPPPPPSSAAAAEFRVAFRGWLGAPRHWELWVAKLRPIHERLWRELGIFDAVLASTYRFKRDASAVLHLASFWSPATNTFAFPWGEATLTLEDVAVLGGFPADGSAVPAPLPPQWGSDEAALNGVRLGLNRSACKKAHHAAWIKYFLTDSDLDTVTEHGAFLALWLTRFVLPGHPESTIRQSLFPLAVRMARGDRVALGPAVLASLYRDLREMKTYLVAAGTTGGNAELLSPLSVYAPLYLLQLWIWERFPILCDGKANPIKDGEPWAARWHDVSKKVNPMVIREVLSSGKNFMWKPYPSCQQACKHHGGWVRGTDISENGELISLAHCVRACELVGADCIEQYLPHRVAMQFGLDQDVPGDVHRANEDWEVAMETYDLEGKNVAIFIPHSEPGVTARYVQWWRQPLPSSDLDVGAGSISVEGKVSKRKVKKTLAAMEAEAEKERKMKKARISPNNDKKRKLEELYDAKLSDWLAAARNGSSGAGGEPGGSCKRGSSPKYDDGSDKALLASVETGKNDIVLLVPRKQVSTLAVNLKKDKDMNLDGGDKLLTRSEYKGVNLKGYMADDEYHPVNEPYFKEEAVVSTEISTFDEDANGEWSNDILKNTNKLVRREIPDVPNRPEELKPPMCMENEEFYDRLTDVDCSEDDREEAVIVDKPGIFISAPEEGNVLMLEDKMVSLREDKCLDATDTPEEGVTVVQELEKKANLAVDESCGMSNRPEEVTALDTEDREEMGGVGKAVEGTNLSSEVVPGSKQGIYTGIMYIPPETAALAEVILPVQQASDVGECIAVSCIKEDTSVADGIRGTKDGGISLNFVAGEKREISCIEEIEGGENNQISEKNIKQKPEKAPQVDIVECGEDITLMEKNNRGENDNVIQTVAKVVTDNNMAAVVLAFPEEKNADVDKALNLAKKDAEDMHKEVVEVEDARQVHISTLENGGANEGHNKVAEVEHIDMIEAKMHAQFGTENPEEAVEVGHADMDDYKTSTMRDNDGEPGDIPEDSHTEVEKAKEQENNNDDKVTEFPDIAHAEKEEVENLTKEDADEKFEEVFDLENTRTCGTHGLMEEDTDGNLNEVSGVVHSETKYMNDLMKEDALSKFQEGSELESIRMGGTHGLMEEDTDGKLNEVSGVVHAETKDMKDFVKKDAGSKVQEISEMESIVMDGTHGPMEEDTDGKLKEVPEVNAEVDEANETEKDNNGPDSILHVHLPSRGEARCFVEEDIKEDNGKVPLVKHANIKDETPVEEDSKEKLNADGKGLAEKEVEEFKEIYQAKQAEGEEYKVLREKDTEENTNDAPGVKHAEEQQDETLSAKYMCDYIEEIAVVEVDGESDTLAKIGAEENPEEITQAQGKEFDNGTMESLKNSANSEVFSSTSIQSKEEQVEVFVEDVTKKQCFQDVDLINERESLSGGTMMEIQGADDHITLNMHDEVAIEQIHDRGMICENKAIQTLEDNHIVHSGSNDLVVMEVDEAFRTHNQEAFDLEKEKLEARQDLGSTIKNNKIAIPGDAIMPGCSEFQTDSPETKISEAASTKVIMSQEHLFINEEHVLEKGLECKLTEGNARPLVVTNVIGGDGVDTTVVTVDVNKANCIQGIQNQEVCSTEELQAREGKQHTGVGDMGILEDTSTNDSGDAGTEKDLCIEKDLAVLEKQNEGTADENTERTLVDTDAPECGEAKHDGTMEMIHETDSAVQAVKIVEDKIPFKNKQKLAVLEKQDEGTTDKNTERTLVDTDAPECGKAKHDGTMEMIYETDSTVQTVNLAEDQISLKKKQHLAVLEKQDEGTTDENTARTLVDTYAPECDEGKHVGAMKMIHETDSTVQAVNMAEDNIPFKNKEKLAVLEKQDGGMTDKNTERTLVDTDAPECGKAKHEGTMETIHETDSAVQAVNLAEDKVSLMNKQNLAVLEKQDEGTADENTERTLVDTDAPECGEAKHDGTMEMIHETDSAVQAVNMVEDKIPFKNKQKLAVLEKQNEGTTDKNTERTLVDTDAPECGKAKHDGTMEIIHETDSAVQALNLAEDKISLKDKQNLAVLEKQDEGTTDENTVRTLVDTDAPECDEVKHVGAMKMIHETDSTVQAVNMVKDKISFKNKQNLTVLEQQNEGTTEENTQRTLVGTDAPGCGEAKHDGTMKTIHGTDSTVQAVNIVKKKITFKIKQKGVSFGDHNKSVAEGSGSNQTARKEFKGAPQTDFEHEVEVKQEILEDRTEMSIGKENDEASEQEHISTEDDTIAPSGMDRGENNNEWAEEQVKSYGKYASNLVNTGCQTSKFGRPSIEEVGRIYSGRSVHLKDIKESQGRIRCEPSNRTPVNSAGYYSRHGVQGPVTVSKDIKVPSHDTVSACGRDRALELVTGPPEETPRWRQEQYALNILDDVQNARIAEKTRMEMEIRILKAQIVSMQKQVMNMDHAGEVVSRSKRH